MDYSWNGNQMWNVATLPEETAKYLKIAGPTQLRVLLWIATVGKGRGNAKDCSDYFNGKLSVTECEDALNFWRAEGLLKLDQETIQITSYPSAQKEEPSSTTTPSAKTLTKSTISKPVMPAVIQRGNKNKEFKLLLQTTESRLGKILSRTDQNRLLDIYDNSGLPVEVIMMIVSYAAQNEKISLQYIQATAKGWAEDGINTIEKANDHLCLIEKTNECWEQLAAWLDLDSVRVTLKQKEYAEKWIHQQQIQKPLLQLAYQNCLDATGKFQVKWMDNALQSWIEDQLTTPEQVAKSKQPAKENKKQKPSNKNGGFDTNEYEEMIKTHTPVFRKKD